MAGVVSPPKTVASKALDVAKATGKVVAKAAPYLPAAAGAVMIGAAILNKTKSANNNFTNGNYSFPNDLENYDAWICFNFTAYERKSIFSQVFEKPSGGIKLPIPAQLVDKYSSKWGEVNQDPAVGAGIESALQKAGGGSGIGGIAGAAIVGGMAGKFGQAAISAVSQATSKIGLNAPPEQILQLAGMAQNPFMTVLFQSPTFKHHSFDWKLAPTTPEESSTLNTIIKKFKYHMLPGMQAGTGGTLLSYPDMANIYFGTGDQYLYPFKHCVVTDMSVNYAPAGSPSFFDTKDNAPVEVTLSLTLMEIEYWLKEDVSNDFGGSRADKSFFKV